MPHKRGAPTPPAPDQVATLKELAKALGRSQDTMTAWKRRGMPGGASGPYSVAAVYAWARGQGFELQPPRSPAMRPVLDHILEGDEDDEDLADGEKPQKLPGTSRYDPLFRRKRLRNRNDAREREELIKVELQNETLRLQQDQVRGKLVTKEEADRGAAKVRDAFVAAGDRLPARVSDHLPKDMVDSVRQKVLAAVAEAWKQLVETVAR